MILYINNFILWAYCRRRKFTVYTVYIRKKIVCSFHVVKPHETVACFYPVTHRIIQKTVARLCVFTVLTHRHTQSHETTVLLPLC